MKPWSLVALACLAVTLFSAEPLFRPPRLSLTALPRLNTRLRDLPESRAGSLVNSGTIAFAYELVLGGVVWSISVEHDTGRVLMIMTSDPRFKTSEGVSVASDVAAVAARYPKATASELGWGEWIDLPSGFAAFIRGPNDKPAAGDKVQAFFQRCR
jgi:hypothetical protein